MKRRMLAAGLLVLALSACGGESNSANAKVSLELITYKPESITVTAGTAVSWRNADATDHTVTSGTVDQQGGSATASPDGRFDSGTLIGGSEFSFTFSAPGTYAYFCRLHPATMRGQITVT